MANEYQTPPVYVPAATGVIHHTPRDRAEIDPDAKGDDRTVAKATEAPPSQTVRKTDEGAGTDTKQSNSDGKPDLGPKTDPANLVRAQEIAGQPDEDKTKGESAAKERGAWVASPAEMVGTPEELNRLDENRDGRIDQLEVQHALRAKGDDTTYAALSNYQKTLGFGPDLDKAAKDGDKAEKLFADEVAAAEKAKLLEKQQVGTKLTDGEDAPADDSSEAASQSDPKVKIVV